MLFLLLWGYMLFFCWNHTLYRAYAEITWKTLYRDMQPVEWRNYTVNKALRDSVGFH